MARRLSEKSDDGVSPAIATLLIIALILILCAILAIYCMGLVNIQWEHPLNRSIPEILAIESVDHYNDGKLTFASKVTLKNIGTKPLCNSDYSAEVYINDTKQFIIIKTLRADEFISTQHYGIKTLSGSGPRGYEWEVGNIGIFDLKDGTVQPGFILRIDIIRKEDGEVISRSIFHVE